MLLCSGTSCLGQRPGPERRCRLPWHSGPAAGGLWQASLCLTLLLSLQSDTLRSYCSMEWRWRKMTARRHALGQ